MEECAGVWWGERGGERERKKETERQRERESERRRAHAGPGCGESTLTPPSLCFFLPLGLP